MPLRNRVARDGAAKHTAMVQTELVKRHTAGFEQCTMHRCSQPMHRSVCSVWINKGIASSCKRTHHTCHSRREGGTGAGGQQPDAGVVGAPRVLQRQVHHQIEAAVMGKHRGEEL